MCALRETYVQERRESDGRREKDISLANDDNDARETKRRV